VHNGAVPKGILFDVDGVLYEGERAIPGAAEAVAWACREGIPHLFVTNTTSRPRDAVARKLAQFGIETTADRVLAPAAAAAAWLACQPRGDIALFAAPALRSEFRDFDLVPEGAERGAHYVVLGDLGEAWDFAKLNRAFRLLMADPAAQRRRVVPSTESPGEAPVLIALGMTRYWRTSTGLSLDVAPFVVALEHATGKRAVVLGKPAREFFLAGACKLGLEPADVLMIGDDIRTDVGGAREAGLKGALVKTGKFREADLAGGVRPDLLLESVAELPGRWATGSPWW